MVKKVTENPEILKKPEWAHWMEKAAELNIKLGDLATKKSDYIEKYPSAFTSTKVKQDPSGQWNVDLDATLRNEAKKAASFGEQSKPYYERMARMIKAHREFFGDKVPYDPVKNLKEIPYSKGRGVGLIEALPKILGADAEHQVLVSVKKNGV